MSYLGELFDHPLTLIASVLLSAPFIWELAKSWFSNIEEDAKEAAPYVLIDLLGGPAIYTWFLVKLLWFALVSVAIVVSFYKVGAWVAEW